MKTRTAAQYLMVLVSLLRCSSRKITVAAFSPGKAIRYSSSGSCLLVSRKRSRWQTTSTTGSIGRREQSSLQPLHSNRAFYSTMQNSNHNHHNSRQHLAKLFSSTFPHLEGPTTGADNKHPIMSPRQKILNRFDNEATEAFAAAEGNPNPKSNSSQTTISVSSFSREVQAQRMVLLDTLDWLEHVVIGYNLCPFAEAPLLRDELMVEVVLGSDQTTILAAVLAEALKLQKTPGTSLVVCPDLAPQNFLSFLEVYNVLVEGILPDHNLQEDIQIAPFHPLFVFGDGEEDVIEEFENNSNSNNNNFNDAIDNYTNRSPYPTFHVLREAEVERAVDALEGNAQKVWKRNVELLQAMEDLFERTKSSSNKELLRSVFLKGRAKKDNVLHQAAAPQDTALPSPPSSSCPITYTKEQIRDYQNQIGALLKEFRKKDY